MIEAMIVFLTISIAAFALFQAAGKRAIGTLILFAGILFSFNALVHGCAPYFIKMNQYMQSWDEKVDQKKKDWRLPEQGNYYADPAGRVRQPVR
jgi:hypothetical protein